MIWMKNASEKVCQKVGETGSAAQKLLRATKTIVSFCFSTRFFFLLYIYIPSTTLHMVLYSK